ncbi:unnamed protein product [Linum tenue]|uniref:Uncharacterized protein n=1 Tax=Linum tenue TaxID=586396 RepID=A0AAV0HA41_9ROSI|nr:unnamed protein product [Linum tenue]
MKSTTPSPIQRQGSAKEYFSGGGERDDSYFDAHPWFDSDNEEFRSVNGDFGSSRIMDRIDSEEADDRDTLSTPRVLNRSSTTSSNTGYLNVRPSRSSSSAKKQLIEFFSDSFSRDLRTEMEEESIGKQPSGGFQKYSSGTSSSTSTDRSVSSPRESMSKPIYNDPRTTTSKKSAVKTSCILLVRSLSCGGGGGNVAEGGKKKKKKRSRRHDFKQ